MLTVLQYVALSLTKIQTASLNSFTRFYFSLLMMKRGNFLELPKTLRILIINKAARYVDLGQILNHELFQYILCIS